MVSIIAVEERLTGPVGEFTLSRTGPTTEPLEVQVLFAETRSQTARPLTVRFPGGRASVTRRVQGGDNALVEDDITMTWTLQEGEGYALSAEHAAASLVLEESDTPEFSVSVEPAEVAEGSSATLTVEITNGVRFTADQTIAIEVAAGTATSGTDFTLSSESLTLRRYASSTRATLNARNGGEAIGTQEITIANRKLAAKFVKVPESHDGQTAFAFELWFSKEIEISSVTLRDTAFQVTGGAVRGARRLASPSNLRWEITVEPSSDADVVLALPATTNCAAEGAICTAGGRGLSQRLEATVKGPGSEDQDEGFPLAPENTNPSGIWSDGETAWVADLDDARLYAYRRSDGERQPAKDIATDPAPMGLWSDGEALWVAGLGGGLRAHRLADGLRLAARDLALEANTAPAGVWSDGETAWVADWRERVYAYRLPEVVADKPGKKPGAGLAARAVSLPAKR